MKRWKDDFDQKQSLVKIHNIVVIQRKIILPSYLFVPALHIRLMYIKIMLSFVSGYDCTSSQSNPRINPFKVYYNAVLCFKTYVCLLEGI